MTPLDNGGPAFPSGPLGETIHEDGTVSYMIPPSQGMTLLDYFVGQALAGDFSDGLTDYEYDTLEVRCKVCYAAASAMLEARKAYLK